MTSELVTTTEPEAPLVYSPPSLWSRWARYWGVRSVPLPELRARYENEHSRYMELDGTRVHYRTEGHGPPLLLLHGVMAHLQTWDGWMAELTQRYTVTRIDVPGFGLTGPMAGGDYSPEYALKFFELARAALGYDRFAIVGNSLGGFLAWYYAAHHPERVDKLILIDPLSYPQMAPTLMRFVTAGVIRPFVPHCAPRFFVSGSLREVYGDQARMAPGLIERYHELLLREGNRAAMLQYFDRADMMFEGDGDGHGKYTRDIARIRCPTLLMWGEEDAWIPASHIESFQRDLPAVQVKRYPGLGHIPMEEAPEVTVRDALDFLGS